MFSFFRELDMTNETAKILTKETDKDVIESHKSEKKRELLPKLNREVHISRMAQ
jgi:hypothetical protein